MVTSSSPADAPITSTVTSTVAVIGSARIEAPDPAWHEACALGAALAEGGRQVMTGGYGGLMGAAARGAHGAGGHVIGLPMRAWTALTPSPWCTELRWSADYAERLRHLLHADAVVALPGGVGTLAEAAVVWSALQTEPGAARLVLLGPRWHALRQAFATGLVIGPDDLALAPVAADVTQAVTLIDQALASGPAVTPAPRG
ncbi:DNA-binding protein [Planotetraspora thailandica]|uniref:DNA-binding protein n=1 Tax=Planotetraspora thailandica TaxID=487172 RepID=A0A8J3XZZ9_9ACTN|nr:LOG family protein [Planotetraspora thailandica]GII58295.1 DNA-binding protein [Planotetraspora thailandica]